MQRRGPSLRRPPSQGLQRRQRHDDGGPVHVGAERSAGDAGLQCHPLRSAFTLATPVLSGSTFPTTGGAWTPACAPATNRISSSCARTSPMGCLVPAAASVLGVVCPLWLQFLDLF